MEAPLIAAPADVAPPRPAEVLLICDADAARVIGHGGPLAHWAPPPPGGYVGAALRDLVGAPAAHALRNALSRALGAPRPVLLAQLTLGPRQLPCDVVMLAAEDHVAFYLQPARPPDPQALDRLRAIADRFAVADSRQKLLRLAPRLLAALGGWDAAVIGFPGLEPVWHKKGDWPAPEATLLAHFAAPPQQWEIFADLAAAPLQFFGAAAQFAADLGPLGCAAPSAAQAQAAATCGLGALFRAPLRRPGAGAEDQGFLLALHRAPRPVSLDERGFIELYAEICALNFFARAN